MANMIETPVLIAGGGPVGMTLALNLARYGVRSLLVERNPTTTRHPKMDMTNARSMELFKRLGLAEKLRDAGVPRENAFDISWVTSLVGHELYRFHYPSANEKREIIRRENDGHHASEPPLRVSQVEIEPVLKRAIDENPMITVRFGTAFERIIDQDRDGVTVEISDSETGARETVRCAFLAGCDGGGSRVRRALGIELDGEMAVAGAHMVHFRTDARDILQRWGPVYHLQTGGGTIIAQNDHDIYTLQAWLIPGLGIEDMRPEDVLEGWVGTKFDYEILQANPWTANFVVAQRYRKGRAVLAGDSAHQFIPTGGYGMNSGIADAAGLSWVLAACVQGWGGESLLDAYDAERRPTAWWHLEAARRHMGVRLAIGEVYAEAGDLDGAGPEADAKRAAVAAKIAALGNAENESWGVEFGYRYDGSPAVCAEPDPPAIDPLTYHPTTWPGARLPHIFLEDGSSVHDKLGLFFTLLAIDDVDSGPIEAAARAAGVPLEIVRLGRPDLLGLYERRLLLVRPDQHVAWRGDTLPQDIDGLLRHVTGRGGNEEAEAQDIQTRYSKEHRVTQSDIAMDPEGYCPANDHPRWNQSVYFNFYDPASRIGCFIRIGILENQRETNSWFAFFRDGKPLFTRINMNLPYTDRRMATGLEVAGMTVTAIEPLKRARVQFDHPDFAVDLEWNAILPMQDAIELTKGGADDGFAKEIAHIHMEGTCAVRGTVRIRGGETISIDGKGFRDIAVGPRNWDFIKHYRLAWPIFDNGLSIVATHGMSIDGQHAYIRMIGRDGGWTPVADIVDRNIYEDDGMTLKRMEWVVTGGDGQRYAFTARRLYAWTFPFDTYVLTEHMMEYTLEDGTKGYGLGECGFRFPWAGNGEDDA